MTELDDFRAEVRSWLEEHAPASLRGRYGEEFWGGRRPSFYHPDAKPWLERMAERRWTAPTWPAEYGGGGLTPEQGKIIQQELMRLKLPAPLVGFGLMMIGPTLLQFGNEEQKREHLPRIVRGEIRWCQGYSEPNAGSDLASLQTSAVLDGDEYVINGQKVWTSYGDLSDWMFLLVRTDPRAKKQQGISFILCDLATPGISIKPIKLISGRSPFCETFFQDVRVPAKNLVGGVNQGWTVAKALLGHERGMIGDVFGTGRPASDVDPVVEVARRYLGDQAGRISDPVLRDRTAQLLMDQACFRLTAQRAADAAAAGQQPGPESSLFKIYGTELNQRRMELLMSIRGLAALGWEGEGFSSEEIEQCRMWLRSRGNTIEGGTSEIQLNIIAKRVLGLPD